LSQEMRELIIYHKEKGVKNTEIAKLLRVSKESVKGIWRLYKEQKSIVPKLHRRGRKPAFSEEKARQIIDKIREQPDNTLAELIEELCLNISISALSRKLTKTDLTFKKRRYFARSNGV